MKTSENQASVILTLQLSDHLYREIARRVLNRPHDNGAILRSSVNEALSAPLDHCNGCSVAGKRRQALSGNGIPNLGCAVYMSRKKC